MNKIFLRIKQEIFNIYFSLLSTFAWVERIVDNTVPYVCQFASPESAEKSLRKELSTLDDPEWKNSGASTQEEYAKWAFTMCGMACTSMALEFFTSEKIQPVTLAEDALKTRVYRQEGNDISDMRYREYAEWVNKYNLGAHVCTSLTVKGIQYALTRWYLVIVSVNPNIRGYDTAPRDRKGWHLVLVTGYDRDSHTITINNPSGFHSLSTQVGHRLTETDFVRYFAGRGIIIKNKT